MKRRQKYLADSTKVGVRLLAETALDRAKGGRRKAEDILFSGLVREGLKANTMAVLRYGVNQLIRSVLTGNRHSSGPRTPRSPADKLILAQGRLRNFWEQSTLFGVDTVLRLATRPDLLESAAEYAGQEAGHRAARLFHEHLAGQLPNDDLTVGDVMTNDDVVAAARRFGVLKEQIIKQSKPTRKVHVGN